MGIGEGHRLLVAVRLRKPLIEVRKPVRIEGIDVPDPHVVIVEDIPPPAQEEVGLGQSRRAAQAQLVVLVKQLGPEFVLQVPESPASVDKTSRERFGIHAEPLAPRLEDGVDDAAHRLAVFRVERTGNHLDFLDQRAVDLHHRSVVVGVVDGYSVHLILDFSGPPAPEVSVHHPGLEVDDIGELLHGQRLNILVGDRGDRAGEVDVDHRLLRHHHDFPGSHGSFFEDRIEFCRPVGGDENRLHGVRAIPDQAELDVVGPRGNVDDAVIAVGSRRSAERRPGEEDIDAGKALVGRLIGYRPYTVKAILVTADRTTRLDAILEEAPVTAGEVVVVAEKPVVDVNLTSTISTVTDKDIQALPVQELTDIVNLQAGVVDGHFRGGHFRGGRAGEVQYQVNGVSVNNSYDNTSVVKIDRSLIQEVQVITGTFDAEYGQAMSGVVNK